MRGETLFALLRPVLNRVNANTAQKCTRAALRLTRIKPTHFDDSALHTTLWDRSFPNPVGLAAGFDKDAEITGALLRLGFGFVEAGTVTPRPQYAHSLGMTRFKSNLEKFLGTRPRPAGLVGINIGVNKSQADPVKDFCVLIRMLGPMADYITLAYADEPGRFGALAAQILEAREKACGRHMPPPFVVKPAPGTLTRQQESFMAAALESGIDGLVLGQDVETIRQFYRLGGRRLPLIAAGNMVTATQAYAMIRAGASLIQLGPESVLRGPGLLRELLDGLGQKLRNDGFSHIKDAVGLDA